MNNKSVMTFSFIFSLVLVSSDVSAFNLGETWGKIVDSSADVLTLGEHGRKRDQERAEQARQASEQARAKEEERLKLQVEMVTADVKLLRDVSKTFYSNYTAVDEIIKLQQGVVSISKDELGKREAAIVVIEKVRNWLREDDQSLINTVVAIGSLSFINSENVESALSTENPEKAITALSKIENDQKHAADAIKNQLEVIRQTNLSESEYLKSSLEKLRTNNLKEIINISS
ncbi:hypothetical protein, partial [Pseudomonas mandelii]|uniref:hypothetical protein n=1 Tax=Pseudomonas mandelii TaxID=75612 RepID=UPI00224B3CDC